MQRRQGISASLRATWDRIAWLIFAVVGMVFFGCVREPREIDDTKSQRDASDLLEPPGHAPGEPHPFLECPGGACPREQPAYLFSGEFHETAVDLRVASCSVGLDLVWARRYRSRLSLPSGQSPLGNGWDHSYNIYLDLAEPADQGSPITIHDGNARPQEFTRDASGSWTAPRYHRSGDFDDDGRFVLTFADGGQWIFRSAEESAQPAIRKLGRIVDRNGNVVELEYASGDRLARVINAVGQALEFEYGADDRIESVVAKLDATTERRVTYQRDDAGDLRRVTLPAILDTVTENDFADGLTTAYTYSDGNLLTIEDARGHVYLRNHYAATQDPNDYEFDRLLSQDWGDVGDTLSMTYAPVTPTVENGFAVTKAWLNDRTGRVSEHFFDAANQRVILREYTGFADPDLPTDDIHNRPEGPLRAIDPEYFETRYAYNGDGHVTREVQPGGSATVSIYEADLDPNAPARIRGNLRERQRQGLACESGPLDSDGSTPAMSPIVERYQYQPGRGNEHGEMNFVTLATDARGSVTEATYDGAGNQTSILYPLPGIREDLEYSAVGQLTRHVFPEDQHQQRREVVHTYANEGHLRETIVDPAGLALSTVKEYDAACNEVRQVDPRGNDKLYVYNEHDQLVREWSALATCSAACGGGPPARAYTDRVYDANMNVVRVDYQALACDGSAQTNDVISTTFEYDILDEITMTRMESTPGQAVENRFELDANREVKVIQYGDAAAGVDPHNTVTTLYDERGRVFQEIQGQGSALAATTQHDYDRNGNEVTLQVGLEGPTRTTRFTYDCADRLIATVDAMGNRTEFVRDPGGNVVEQRMYGELLDLPDAADNILLERVVSIYDSMNRVVQMTRDHFDPAAGAVIGDGQAVASFTYDGESRVILEHDDNGQETAYDFDAAGRLVQKTDAVGNIVEFEYDANGNLLTRTLIDVPSSPGDALVGVWSNVYDAQSNLTETGDPVGSTWHNCYDSLGSLRETIDPRGNHTRHIYDGAGRLLATNSTLTDDGTGLGAVVGYVTTAQTWDASGRLTSRSDPKGNATQYMYDSLNRPTTEIFADGTTNSFEYDIHGNMVVYEDGNGTILSISYDALDRPIEVDIDAGPGVNAQTSFESFSYDGRSSLTRASDDDSEVWRAYDSLGGLLSETQTFAGESHEVAYARDGVGNAKTTLYPGGRQIDRFFDGRRRTSRIEEYNATLVEIEYLGPSLLRKRYAEVDTQSNYVYDPVRRMVHSEHIEAGEGAIDRRDYAFDAAGNKQSEADLGVGTPTGFRAMQHDSLGRMVESDVSGSAVTDRTVAYVFDGAGNRTSVSGDACPGAYTQAGGDALANQYTEIPCEDWSHDEAGNLIESQATAGVGQSRQFQYDHRGRLVKVWIEPGTADEVALEFAYDALGRKVHAIRSDANEGERYVYDDWNVIEEYSGRAMNPSATYLYGDGLDERLQMVRGGSWWYFDDELGSVSAVARRDGDKLVVERYAYQDYGEPTFLTAPTSGNPYLFAGGRWLAEIGMYDLRTRHFDATSGRFISRDTLGIWGDEENLGNGYTYVGNMPDTHTDPMGESKKPVVENCHTGARADIEAALDEAQRMGTLSRDWFNRESDRKRTARKNDWNKQRNDGRLWWGKYSNTRFNRIKWNFRKIVQRCQKDVITFKCRTTGDLCGKSTAWTHSVWGATIRLCKQPKGFFRLDGVLGPDLEGAGGIILHEISHNINAIGDKKLNEVKPYTESEVQNLAKKNPLRASWNAQNYESYSVDR